MFHIYIPLYSTQIDGAKSPDAVFEDVKAIFSQLNTTQVHSHSCSLLQLLKFRKHVRHG